MTATEEMDPLTELVAKMSERVEKMRGLPDLQEHRCYVMPGEHIRRNEDGEFRSIVQEDAHWGKIDKVILKALDAMKKAGERDTITRLRERVYDLSMEHGDLSLRVLAVRLIDTAYKVEEYGRLRRVAAKEEPPREGDSLFYGDGTPEEMVQALGAALHTRGILKKKKQKQQEQE